MFLLQKTYGEELLLEPAKETEVHLLSEEKIALKSVITEIPSTSWDSLKMAFSKESVPYWGLILGTTGILYAYDEPILSSVQYTGRKWGIGNDDHTRAAFDIGPWPLRLPTDKGSAMYFMGDGLTHFAIAGSFIGYGHYTDNVRAYNTGLEIVHGMAVSTFFSQILKRSFGRESPVRKTEYRGNWDFFPTFTQYGDNTAKYDAMPSGHVMTATLTFTVIMENYPEYRYFLLPTEILYVSVLSLQMINNGVHWASDYPLGIAMGYLFGKTSAKLGKKKAPKKDEPPEKYSWMVVPGYSYGQPTTNFILTF